MSPNKPCQSKRYGSDSGSKAPSLAACLLEQAPLYGKLLFIDPLFQLFRHRPDRSLAKNLFRVGIELYDEIDAHLRVKLTAVGSLVRTTTLLSGDGAVDCRLCSGERVSQVNCEGKVLIAVA